MLAMHCFRSYYPRLLTSAVRLGGKIFKILIKLHSESTGSQSASFIPRFRVFLIHCFRFLWTITVDKINNVYGTEQWAKSYRASSYLSFSYFIKLTKRKRKNAHIYLLRTEYFRSSLTSVTANQQRQKPTTNTDLFRRLSACASASGSKWKRK